MLRSGRRVVVAGGPVFAQAIAALTSERDQLKLELKWTKQSPAETRAALTSYVLRYLPAEG